VLHGTHQLASPKARQNHLEGHLPGGVELAVEEVVISPASPLVGKTLVEAQNSLSRGGMIVALKRSGKLMSGSRLQTRLNVGDTVLVVGTPEQLAAFQ
jgi:TrkA domain protein